MPSVFEICAGGGGQALGLEAAGFDCAAAVEILPIACETLRTNRPGWKVIQSDVRDVGGTNFSGVDLLAGGVPCPPFSIAGKQLGANDDRDLFPEALRLASEIRPRAIMLENVPGFASEKFRDYRRALFAKLRRMGYEPDFRILNARDFGVPQLRPRCIIVALRKDDVRSFRWPEGSTAPPSVGETLADLMSSRGWPGASLWQEGANGIAPTVVGGSTKHGGPDLGPTRARKEWARLGVDGLGIANEPPGLDFDPKAAPKLTVRMVARIQGFPDHWTFAGKKTAAYRQVGNALPPPVAEGVARAILAAFEGDYEVPYEHGQARLFETSKAVSI